MTTYTALELFIDGRFLSGQGRVTEPVFDPATGRPIADLPHASAADLDAALDAAARAFPAWSATTASERAKVLRRAADLIRARIEVIATVMTLEQGKPVAESRGEIAYAADVIEWYAEEGRRTYGRVVPSRVPGVAMTVTHEPVGPVAAFTPWNFPALTPCRKIGGALAAGCTLVLKAAEEVPGTAVEIARAFADAGLPAGVLNLVFGKPAEVSAHLIASPAIRKVSFTGSTAIGKHLMALCAHDLKRTTMELGGHGPVVVFDDVDVEATAELAATAKYRNAGQVCISPTRFFVQEAAYDRFVARFTDVAKGLKLGAGLEAGVQMGPLANPRRIQAMEAIVQDVRDRGGKVETGGARRGNEGWFYAPTVVTGIGDDALVMTEEPFGPVAPIVPFADFDEVVRRANSLPYGLAAYAFSTSARRIADIGAALKAGMVGLNTLAVSNPETPFGGVRDSGHGQEGGVEGLQAYLDVKFTASA
ncbi:NAD-dependent succinate-semialdehyde dehydrogenase [Caulobacter rhizosphaerae]|jgi:succinate-semialdehyde dehydrogenase/glutarate-semialdehyde dehydrogenase|uniref:NAD-dependent succinate-semialdehyde dehydrogenase n=1 Tax=Caulobacter rhizosphaerae TaxID=2010972 RepID=UPI0013D0BF57|nr:NAD-dependent succinate-semialdehyde dehydrogenase [Caulobacter rhizosphaerae]GGL46985.1 NAD-dependent succinate-semialdehyde dehydrogenase [Caulobacter rhizosphaerae]